MLFQLVLLTACSTPPVRMQANFSPPGSVPVGHVFRIAKREQVAASAALHRAIQAAGVSDAALVDGTVVAARIYRCGGVSRDYSAEHGNSINRYVPPDMRVGSGDFVEFKAGGLNDAAGSRARPGWYPAGVPSCAPARGR